MSFLNYLGGARLEVLEQRIAKYNNKGIAVSASILPRKLTNKEDVKNEVDRYEAIMKSIVHNNYKADITIKLHQFAFYENKEACEVAVRDLLNRAASHGVFVWLDAMLADEVDFRVDLYLRLRDEYHDKLGIAIQAYHTGAINTAERLLSGGAQHVRVVKGIYHDCQLPSWEMVGQQYEKMANMLIGRCARTAIATHDPRIIANLKNVVLDRDAKSKVEFQHMAGINDEQLLNISDEGYTTRVYLPMGEAIPYFIDDWRRLDWWRGMQRALGWSTIR